MKRYNEFDAGNATVDLPYEYYSHSVRLFRLYGQIYDIDLRLQYYAGLNAACSGEDTSVSFGFIDGMKLSLQKKAFLSGDYIKVITESGRTKYFVKAAESSAQANYLSRGKKKGIFIISADGTMTLKCFGGIIEEYNADGNITAVKMRTGQTIRTLRSYSYADGRLINIVDGAGRKITLSYDTNGRVSGISAAKADDENSRIQIVFEYSADGVTVKRESGAKITYAVNGKDVVIASKDINNTVKEKITCEYVTGDDYPAVKLTRYYGERKDKCLKFIMIERSGLGALNLVEIRNEISGARYRRQYNRFGYDVPELLCSYEVAVGADGNADPFVITQDRYGNPIYKKYKCDVEIVGDGALTGRIGYFYSKQNDRIFVGLTEEEYRMNNMPFVTGKRNYYTFSGWMKPNDKVPISIDFRIRRGTVPLATFTYNKTGFDDEWRFFSFDFCLEGDENLGGEWIISRNQNSLTVIGDIRITPADENIAQKYSTLTAKTSSAPTGKIYLPYIHGIKYTKNGQSVETDCEITSGDIDSTMRYRAEYKVNDVVFINNGTFIDGCADVMLKVGNLTESGYVSLDDYGLTDEFICGDESYAVSRTYSSTDVFKTEHITVTKGAVARHITRKYDCDDKLLEITADDEITTYSYNEFGLLCRERTTNGNKYIEKSVAYSADGNSVLNETDADGVTTAYTSDEFWGNVVSITKNSIIKTYATDGATGKTTAINFVGGDKTSSVTIGYADGEPSRISDGYAVYGIVRQDGRVTAVNSGEGSSAFALNDITYDDAAFSVKESYGAETTVVDRYGRIKSIDAFTKDLNYLYGEPNEKTTSRGYENDVPIKITNAEDDRTVEISYADGKPAEYVTKETSTQSVKLRETVSRDAAGRITEFLQNAASENFSSVKTNYEYVSAETDPLNDERYGKITSAVNNEICEIGEIAYDVFKRPVSVQRTCGDFVNDKTCVYDGDGDRTFNRIKFFRNYIKINGSIVDGGVCEINYDAAGKIASATEDNGNGGYRYSYDGLGRLSSVEDIALARITNYEYGADGNVTKETVVNKSTDAVISTVTFGYSADNPERLTSYNGKSITYSSDGKVLKCDDDNTYYFSRAIGTSDSAKNFKWANNTLTGFSQGNIRTTGLSTWNYVYDRFGRRVCKEYIYNKGRQVAIAYTSYMKETYEYDTQGRLLNLHRYTIDQPNDERNDYNMTFFYGADGVDGFVFKRNSLQAMTYYYIKNAFGDIIAIRDSSGNIDSSYRYGAFGECTAGRQGACYAVNPFRYRGYFYDVETKMYYLKNRYYNPAWHRFMNPDHPDYIDVETVHGLNLYMYCGNDPINNIDPTGNGIITIMLLLGLGTLAGGIAGGIISKRNGNSGWEVAKDVILWASMGLAIVGGAIATTSVFIGGFYALKVGKGLVFHVAAKQSFAIGALAFNFTALFVAPLYGIKMQPIEYETPVKHVHPYTQDTTTTV